MLAYDPETRIKPEQALSHPFFKRSSTIDRPKTLLTHPEDVSHQSLMGQQSLTDMLVSPLKPNVEVKMETSPESKHSVKLPPRPQVGKLFTYALYIISTVDSR